jgi:hypothetical protein
MQCPICYGRQVVWRLGVPWPCPQCSTQGVPHCCDGLSEQPLPEPEPNDGGPVSDASQKRLPDVDGEAE